MGSLSGDNRMVNNDFNARGEYTGGPDGCAFDFETAATGFLIANNTFYRSWGAGVMIFGHTSTSQGIAVRENVFVMDGCGQPRNDRGGVAVICPGGHKPSGAIEDNAFYTCSGQGDAPAVFVNPAVPGCADHLNMSGNTVDSHSPPLVGMPAITVEPPLPSSTATEGLLRVKGVSRTPNATLRYTLDGSRPSEASDVVPTGGLELPWPGPARAVNMRAFLAGSLPSVTNGVLLELDYVLGREAPTPRGVASAQGVLDALSLGRNAASVHGWVVDVALPAAGRGPVTVQVSVDSQPVAAGLAADARPDLVPAGVAPDAHHGFNLSLSAAVVTRLQQGRHTLDVHMIGSPSSELPWPLQGSPLCVCDGKLCSC